MGRRGRARRRTVEKLRALPDFKEGWQLGPPDLILEAAGAYTLPASGPDVYWNFIIPAGVTATRYVRAMEIRPGDKRIVHHANLYVDRARSARRQEIAEGQGFPGMDVAIDRAIARTRRRALPVLETRRDSLRRAGRLFAWRLDPGSDLVLNAHLQPTGKPEQVRPSIGLYFTDKPPEQFPMLVQLEHDGAINIPPGARDFLRLRRFPSADGCRCVGRLPARALLGTRARRLRHAAQRRAQMADPHSQLGPQLARGVPLSTSRCSFPRAP